MSTNEDTIAQAAEAVNGAREVVAARAGERAALETEVAALQARLAQLQGTATPPATTPTAPAPTAPTSPPRLTADDALLAEFRQHKARERDAARIEMLRGYGLSTALNEPQVLAIAPDVDPRDPDGRAAYDAWRADNPHLFRPPVNPLEAELAAKMPARMVNSGLFNAAALVGNHAKMAVAAGPPRRTAAAFDTEATRAKLVARSRPTFNGATLAHNMLGPAPTPKP
jgi:hypothetical protein